VGAVFLRRAVEIPIGVTRQRGTGRGAIGCLVEIMKNDQRTGRCQLEDAAPAGAAAPCRAVEIAGGGIEGQAGLGNAAIASAREGIRQREIPGGTQLEDRPVPERSAHRRRAVQIAGAVEHQIPVRAGTVAAAEAMEHLIVPCLRGRYKGRAQQRTSQQQRAASAGTDMFPPLALEAPFQSARAS